MTNEPFLRWELSDKVVRSIIERVPDYRELLSRDALALMDLVRQDDETSLIFQRRQLGKAAYRDVIAEIKALSDRVE